MTLTLTAEYAMRFTFRLRHSLRAMGWPYLVWFAVLANVPLWIAGSVHRLDVAGWFDLDFLVVGVLALFLPRAVSAVLLLLAMMVDFLAEVSFTYFISPAEILSNIGEIRSMPAVVITQILLGGVVVLAIASGVSVLPRMRRRFAPAAVLLVFALVCRGLNELEKHHLSDLEFHFLADDGRSDPSIIPAVLHAQRPARSSTRQLMWAEREYAEMLKKGSEVSGQASAPMESAAAIALRWLSANASEDQAVPDFVLILVESWGQSSDEGIRQALVQPYAGLNGKFSVLQGTVPFDGATISGENRELCGRTGGQELMMAENSNFQNCLPAQLRSRGFHTMAIHGFLGGFYDRNYWYPRAGFEEMWFERRLEGEGLPKCRGAFSGICDAAVGNWIGKRLARPEPGPRFVYWITLNSHLPVPNPPSLPRLAPCENEASLAQSVTLCNWYRLVLNVHESIASVAGQERTRSAVFVIVGDHAPPFAESALRNGFDRSYVPYMILLPRADLRAGAAGLPDRNSDGGASRRP